MLLAESLDLFDFAGELGGDDFFQILKHLIRLSIRYKNRIYQRKWLIERLNDNIYLHLNQEE